MTTIGVLFVHGIGAQQAGETLRGFGGPLIESVGKYLGDTNVHRSPWDPAPGEPERERVTIRDGARTLDALAAESCWADTVKAPSYGTLLRWLGTAVPFLVTRALDTGLRRTNRAIDARVARSRGGALRPALEVLVLVPVRLLQNLLVVAVSLLVLVPLALLGVFGVLGKVLAKLRGPRWFVLSYIGDSYALLEDQAAAAAMAARVERDLGWLERQVGDAPLVVVAHSQGAEVTRRVLARRMTPVAAFVTFGSGIVKLDAVDRLRKSLGRSLLAFGIRIVSAGALVLAVAGIVAQWSPWLVAGLVVVAFGAVTLARALMRSVVGAGYDESRLGVGPQQVARWIDLFATSDPVSEGQLPLRPPGLSAEIVNRRLLFTDHTSYWQNVEAFRAAVALEIARVAGWRKAMDQPKNVIDAARSRAGRVWWLVGARWLVVAGAATGWVALGRGALAGALLAAAAIAGLLAVERLWSRWSTARTDALFPKRQPRQLTPA